MRSQIYQKQFLIFLPSSPPSISLSFSFISLYSPGYSGTHWVDLTVLEIIAICLLLPPECSTTGICIFAPLIF